MLIMIFVVEANNINPFCSRDVCVKGTNAKFFFDKRYVLL